MNTKYILLWLEAPLQSWGADSKFGRRETLPFPTKSGLLGLLLCALGAGGEQKEFLSIFSHLRQTILSYVRTGPRDGSTAKSEREPLLRDFHMVGSGYRESDSWQLLHIPKTSDGKKAVGGGTKLTYRFYLQDAFFAAILEVPQELVDTLADALQNPVFSIFLGRKNCVPTDFLYRGIFETEQDAIAAASRIAEEKKLLVDFRVVDGELEEGEVCILNDVPVQFGERKLYRDRRVTILS